MGVPMGLVLGWMVQPQCETSWRGRDRDSGICGEPELGR